MSEIEINRPAFTGKNFFLKTANNIVFPFPDKKSNAQNKLKTRNGYNEKNKDIIKEVNLNEIPKRN